MPVRLIDKRSRPNAIRFVRFANEHRPPFRVRVERNGRKLGVSFRVVFTDRVDKAHRGLAAVDDRDTPGVVARHLFAPEHGFDRVDGHRFGRAG